MIAAVLLWALAQTATPHLNCEFGPIERRYGDGDWLVFACDDRSSVIVVSKRADIIGTFVYVLHLRGGHYVVDGEGNGRKASGDAAYDALVALGDDGVRRLLSAVLAGLAGRGEKR
ncbi:MAG: hypothetical protein J0I47_11230 [Sphingomonas sp.]|uniref:hypothetical protein n=1 Tax=Sphingomonas sp. TaxID=28214 RepID=UPI001AC2D677|nr:hypothetical protein [Sphingomonas sp.]MBN8808785.1 hypothetical protein [Sphingomonas sp.]